MNEPLLLDVEPRITNDETAVLNGTDNETFNREIEDLRHSSENLELVLNSLVGLTKDIFNLKKQRNGLYAWVRKYFDVCVELRRKEYDEGNAHLPPEDHEPFILGEIRLIINKVRRGEKKSTRNAWAVKTLKGVFGPEKHEELTSKKNFVAEKAKVLQSSKGQKDKVRRLSYDTLFFRSRFHISRTGS